MNLYEFVETEGGADCVNVCPKEYNDDGKGLCKHVDCEDREIVIPNVEQNSCGYHCLFDRYDNSCRSSCTNEDHYEISGSICILKRCAERKLLLDGSVCGSDNCYEEENKCTEIWWNCNDFYGNIETHVCEAKPWSNRTTNWSGDNPCGSGCYLDPNAG
jgi:hypothetical protein